MHAERSVLRNLLFLIGLGTMVTGCVSPGKMFRRNAELKAQGYYLAEFEFKMEAALYHLNEGSYWEAYQTLRRIKHELETTEGLHRIPPQASPEELLDFLLARQAPETGAFMDPAYPYFTYIGPTANVLETIETLANQTGRPPTLRYPLRFLDQLRSPEQLTAYLDSLLYFQELWADRFGGPTPFCPGASELSQDSLELFERVGGYRFPDGWKETLLTWFARHQDPKTGFWGARIGTAERWRQALDIDSTAHILKLFLDERGEPRDPRFPLSHADALAQTLLGEADTTVPEGAVDQHEWALRQAHAAKIFVRYLWPRISPATKSRFLALAPVWLERRFTMFRPDHHGFAVDSSSPLADIDATGMGIALLRHLGGLPGTWERARLWGEVLEGTVPTTQLALDRWEDAVVPPLAEVNSLRVYADQAPQPETLDDAALVQLVYPKDTLVLDLLELRLQLVAFLETEGGELGNWDSKASLKELPLALDGPPRAVPVVRGALDLGSLAASHPKVKRFIVLGVDRLQVPRQQLEFSLREAP